jgi:hypothetical protein
MHEARFFIVGGVLCITAAVELRNTMNRGRAALS